MAKNSDIQVSYRRITANKDMLAMLFPSAILDALNDTKTYVYGAIEAKRRSLVGACILSISEKIPKAAIIHYCAVSDRYMRNGIGSGLVDTAAKNLKTIGIDYLIYREVNQRHEPLLNSYRFATHNNFVPGAVQEHILYYKLEDLSSNQKLLSMKGCLRNIEKIEDTRDERVTRFNKSGTNGFYTIRRNDYAPKYSGFYMEKGNIKGSCKVFVDDDTVIINDIFMAPDLTDLNAYEMLLYNSVLSIIVDSDIEELCIQAVGDEKIQEVKRLLGEPANELPALELIRYLNGKES
ncbi:MAG: GNAT family N-acetyltransferase [Butyrivibrio sp.]|nr:GNAT family N-acetyltransferase [Butyrivibrio sp.]